MNFTQWAHFNADTLVGKLLRLPLRLLPKGRIMSVLQGVNKGYRWRVGSGNHGCWLGIYEADKQKLMHQWVKPGMVAYDIGAHAGFYTLALARWVGNSGRVYAFEPFAENAANLLEHLRLNRCDNAMLYQLALSDGNGFSAFQAGQSNSMGCLGGLGSYRVPTATIDALIKRDGLPAPDIVKMDVEGAESRVLEGASLLLGMRKTIWFIALHGAEQRDKTVRILADHGYRVYRLDGSPIDAANIDTDEIFALPGPIDA